MSHTSNHPLSRHDYSVLCTVCGLARDGEKYDVSILRSIIISLVGVGQHDECMRAATQALIAEPKPGKVLAAIYRRHRREFANATQEE